MLDIGGDIGAIVVTMPVEMVGQEVDLLAEGEDVAAGVSQTHAEDDHDHGHDHGHGHGHDHGHGHGHGHRPHVAVVRRPLPGSTEEIPSLVYPEVREGRYRLLMKGTDVVTLEVDVVGGEVTEAVWPG